MSADSNLILAITSLILDFIVKLRTVAVFLCVFLLLPLLPLVLPQFHLQKLVLEKSFVVKLHFVFRRAVPYYLQADYKLHEFNKRLQHKADVSVIFCCPLFRSVFRAQSNIYCGAFCENSCWKPLTVFAKSSILYVRLECYSTFSTLSVSGKC